MRKNCNFLSKTLLFTVWIVVISSLIGLGYNIRHHAQSLKHSHAIRYREGKGSRWMTYVSEYQERRHSDISHALKQEIDNHQHDFSIQKLFRDLTLGATNEEANACARVVISVLAKKGLWKCYKDILNSDNMIYQPDTFTFTSAMSSCIKYNKFSEAADIFDDMLSR